MLFVSFVVVTRRGFVATIAVRSRALFYMRKETMKGTFIHKRKSIIVQIMDRALDAGLRVSFSRMRSGEYKCVVR